MKSTPFKEYFSERKFNNAKIILSSVKSVGLNSRLQRVWQFSSWRRKKSFIYSSWSEDLLKVVCNFTFDTSSEVKIRCVWYFDEKLIPNDENIKHKKYFNTITIIKKIWLKFLSVAKWRVLALVYSVQAAVHCCPVPSVDCLH